MADFNQELKQAIVEVVGPVFQRFQGVVPLGVMRDNSIEAIREYFYFGLEEKICSKCQTQKDKKQFGIDTSKPDGLFVWCKPCRAERYQIKHSNAKL